MDWAEGTVLVTGGAGFIGSHLVDRLVADGREVVVADDVSRGDLENVAHLIGVEDVELRPVDLTTRAGARRAVAGVDHVFHLAARVGGIHYIKRENVGGLTPSVLMNHHLLEAAREAGVARFLYASSACVYRERGEGLNRFSEEEVPPANPHSTYGWAKVLGEQACRAYHEDTGMDCGMVRIFNAYGPRETLDLESAHVIPAFVRKAIEYPEREFVMFGDGSQQRGFIYVTDLVEGLIRAMDRAVDGEPLNLGNGEAVVSIGELADLVVEISEKEVEIEHDTDAPEGTSKYAADTTRMERKLDWTPSIGIEEGVRRTYEWAAEELGDDGERTAASTEGSR